MGTTELAAQFRSSVRSGEGFGNNITLVSSLSLVGTLWMAGSNTGLPWQRPGRCPYPQLKPATPMICRHFRVLNDHEIENRMSTTPSTLRAKGSRNLLWLSHPVERSRAAMG